jgi:hypothetical protein
MKLIHFNDAPVKLDGLIARGQEEYGSFKPTGLWVSDEKRWSNHRRCQPTMRMNSEAAYGNAMTQALIIGEAERKQIADLRALAAANPQDVVQVQTAANRDIAAFREMMETLSLQLPVGYRIAYSHEMQPKAGLCHHISISVARPKKMPSQEAVEMILQEFGMRPMSQSNKLWIEDVDHVTKAINIVQVASSKG